MTDLEELKYQFFKERFQLVLLDERGFVQHSCDTLFNMDRYRAISLFDDIAILESLKEDLLGIEEGQDPLFLPRLDFELDGLKRFVDFFFLRFDEDNRLIMWYILEQNVMYSKLLEVIQQRNELYIRNWPDN